MNLYTLSPYIRVAIDYTVPQKWYLKERVIFDYELLFVKEGEVIVTIEDIDYHGIPGDMFLIKPRQKHSMQLASDVLLRHPHIHFDLYYHDDSPKVNVSFKPLKEIAHTELSFFREDVCSVPPFQIPNHIRLKNSTVTEKLMFDIIHEFEQKPLYYEHNCKGIFIQLWMHLLRELHWNENYHIISNWEVLNEVKTYLRLNPYEKISVEELAKMANFSKSHFITIFKAAFGTTPSKYQQLMRLEKAKELIQFTNISLTEIAEMCGYESIHSFSLTFKKGLGVEPSFYRRKEAKLV